MTIPDEGTDASAEPPRPARSAGRCPCCGAVVARPGVPRPFTITDAMTLVAASAVAFVIVRPLVDGPLERYPPWARYLAGVMGFLVTWTPTVLLLRLRRPRPTLRRLTREPGFAAGLAGTAVLLLGVLATGLLALLRLVRQGAAARAMPPGAIPRGARPPDPSWWLGVVLEFGVAVGPAVLGAWLLLACIGRRRPARGWLDPLGRAIGTAWVVLFVVHCCVRLAHLQH